MLDSVLAQARNSRYRELVLVPLLLICGATASAVIIAYGTSADLARYAHGIQIIAMSRRLEWLAVALSLAFCVALLAITISGRRRVWWLLGLAPVLALFVRGFSSSYHPSIPLLESPKFVAVDQCANGPGEYVVGLQFDGKPYAFPYSALANSPLVLLTAFDKRALIIWSMTANRCVVLPLDRDAEPRDIEVVSSPADSLLLFDGRLGQFIVGVTGQTLGHQRPPSLGSIIQVKKMPLADWTQLHPDTLVMVSSSASAAVTAPVLPVLHFLQPAGGPPGDASIAMLDTSPPSAVPMKSALNDPVSVIAGETRVLLERDSNTGMLRAFDRHLKEDLFLTLKPLLRHSRKFPTAALVDSESGSLWTKDGHAIDGPFKGESLPEISVEDGLYWGVMKFWIPDLKLVQLP